MLLTRYLVCGFGVLALCLFWVIWRRTARRVYFYGMGRLSWHSKGKDWRDLGLQWGPALCPPELPEFGKERGDPGRSCGWSLLDSHCRKWLSLLGLCWQRTRCHILSPALREILRSSQGHCSKTEFFCGESLLPFCLHVHSHAQKNIPIPPDRQTELHKVKTSPLIKVTVKQSNLAFFPSSPRITGFFLKIPWKFSLTSIFQWNLNFLGSATSDEETFYYHWHLILSCP